MKRHFFLFFLLLAVFLILSLFRASGVSAAVSPPTASLSGPSSGTVGQSLTYRVDLGREAQRGEIWITKSDKTAVPNCPGQQVTGRGISWCNLARQESGNFTGSYTPSQEGTYVLAVNGFMPDSRDTNPADWFTGFPDTECTGNPFTDGFNPAQWSDCGGNDNIQLTVSAAPIAIPGSPTNPSASCPAPGTTANFSWSGVSGAGGYTVYAFDKAGTAWAAPKPWDVPCGSGGRDVCTRVTGTSASASGLRPGVEYQWFVFACSGNTNNCSDPASASFTCAAPVTVASATFNGQPLDLNGAILSTRLALPSGATSVDVPIDVTDSSGSTRHLIIKFNYLSPPTNPAASCPAPGTTANFSWSGVSGAGGYTVYAFDNAQRIDWSTPCGSGGRDVCTRVTGTSASASGLRPGVEYQWFVFACIGNTNNCSEPVSASFTCAASSTTVTPLPPPTNPAASCPAPGTTANFSWSGVSGASRYDLYVHNTADPALVWGSVESGGNACTPPNSCERLTTTSKSLSARIPGATYQWFVFACNSSGCSSEAGGSFTCGAPSPTPPRPIPGDADDNSCVSNADLAQWTKEVKGDCHRCSAWTSGATRKFAEDYNIWYDAFKAAKTLCGPAPASNCTTSVCQ